MLINDVRTVENIPSFLDRVKRKETVLYGFGHRAYKNFDPRAGLIRDIATDVFDVCGYNSLVDLAEKLAEAALKDEYFVSRKLYPNVDFWSGLIYDQIGFPRDMFPVLFALGRVAGWLAHWKESLNDPEEKIYRPTQIYQGAQPRDFLTLSRRQASANPPNLKPLSTSGGKVKKRRLLSKL